MSVGSPERLHPAELGLQRPFFNEDVWDLYVGKVFKTQTANYLCGPTTIHNLQILLGFKESSIEDLAELCDSDGDGTNSEDVVSTLREVGIQTGTERRVEDVDDIDIAEIDRELEHSVMVVNFYNSMRKVGHFNILIGSNDTHFFFIDSSLTYGGLYRLSKEDFRRNWHNQTDTERGWGISIPIDQAVRR